LASLDWAVGAGVTDEVWRETCRKVRRRRRRRLAAAGAAVAVCAFAAVGLFGPQIDRVQPALAATDVRPSEVGALVITPARRSLPDGTSIDLRPGAEIRVAFSAHERFVALLAGEAHFAVAKDPSRPFVVAAAGMRVRAVGTAFSVDVASARIAVLVTEGTVAVETSPPAAAVPAAGSAPPEPADSPAVLAVLDAGRRLVVARDAAAPASAPLVSELTADEIDARLAWRAPRLNLSRTPLADALPHFNRHGSAQLVLGDPTIGEVRLSGILRADNTATLLRLLEAEYGLRAEPRAGSELVLKRR
jgi:transmembrane sensor